MKNDLLGSLFGELLELRGHFFCYFGVLGSSLDLFGARGGPGMPNPGTDSMLMMAPGLHLGAFFDQKRVF